MVTQVMDEFRSCPRAQIFGASDNHERERLREPHYNHVGINELTHSDASVESSGGEINQFLACGDLHLDLWISLAERDDYRLQDQRNDRSRNGKPQESGGALPEFTHGGSSRGELFEGRLGSGQESLASFSETDTARRANEERNAHARLECTHRLTHRRGSDAQLCGRSPKAAVPGDAE